MFELRMKGWSYSALGRMFHKDHTTIMYHCQKFGIVFNKPTPIEDIFFIEEQESEPLPLPKPHKYDYLFEKDGPINKGKTYAQYIEDAKKQKYGHWYRVVGTGNGIHFTRLTKKEDQEGGFGDAFDTGMVPEGS